MLSASASGSRNRTSVHGSGSSSGSLLLSAVGVVEMEVSERDWRRRNLEGGNDMGLDRRRRWEVGGGEGRSLGFVSPGGLKVRADIGGFSLVLV